MNTEKNSFTERLLWLLPYWHYKIDKPFKLFLRDKMSLETYYCLQTLRERGPMTMTEICRLLKISKQQASKMIETLHKYHFVERQSSEEDRRCITICVTERAINYMEMNIFRNTEFLEELEARLDRDELNQLEEAFETLLKILPKLE